MEDKKEKAFTTEKFQKNSVIETIKHIICLILPVISAFIGYYLSPWMWTFLNKANAVPEIFRFVCSIIFFAIPSTIIFIETRSLNPIISITLKDKE